ncbi:unnamed protein product [Cuscuta campestris]|uniref:Reverse transcriptase domain-containing protein n=1 Tax=Cuscuta campestris TaxID=132261 RepID=A0A484N3B6_9ASTE|nr:unnamed protein product [Cuscuta campestris]
MNLEPIPEGDEDEEMWEFFMGLPIPRAYGSTYLTLIPKSDNPRTFDDYRPISLSTFMSKINTKILAGRLNSILPKLISKEQAAFQKGKSIDDHILMAQEAVHLIDKKTFGGNLILKMDMAKAFDKLDWEYLEALLQSFGFNQLSTSLLMANLKGSFFSILLNGEPAGYFKMERGVKQGDPFSPLLFILAADGFSRLINHQMNTQHLLRFNSGQVPFPSHLIYADDIMIFSRGETRNLLKLKVTLETYLKASGQEINLNKSKFYTSKNTTTSQTQNMEKALGIKRGKLPFTYLGAPICRGILRKEHCKEVLGHFEKRIQSWIFLWKLLNGALPFPQNLGRFASSLPSMCPLCKNNNDDTDHCLLHCPTATTVWNKLAALSNGPSVKENTTLRQHLLAWWFGSSTKNFKGTLRIIFPGLCTWSLWKARNSSLHNATIPTAEGIFQSCLKTLQSLGIPQ